MTLLLNYRPVLREPTGIGVYANAVLPTLQELPHVLMPGGERGSSIERLIRLTWSQRQLPKLAKAHNASLIFTPAPEGYLGYQRIRQVVMVHDLRPITHPELSLQSLYFRAWVPKLLNRCCCVLTNSEFTAQEIQRNTGLPDSQIYITPLGYDDRLFQPIEHRDKIRTNRYFLHVGQAYPHKNLRRLVRAFAYVAERNDDARLILAGKCHRTETPILKRIVHSLNISDKVDFISYLPGSELAALYQNAEALIYPSLWEGFGLPVIEAMACGTPVITSLQTPMEHHIGNAGIAINPYNVTEIAEAMLYILDNKRDLASMRLLSLQRASLFSWESCAAATANILGRLL